MDIFTCKICEERYDEDEKRVPRILTACGHSICEICALKIMKNSKVVCPFDRIESAVLDGNVKNLKKNFGVLEAIQEHQYKISSTNTESDKKYEKETALGIPCDEDATHIAVIYCTNCKVNLCERCSMISHSLKMFASHKLVKVSEKPEAVLYCRQHEYNVADLFCTEKSCQIANKVMCANCYLYGVHKNHQYKTINDAHEEKKREIMEILSKTQKAILNVKMEIEKIGEIKKISTNDKQYIDGKKAIDEKYKQDLKTLKEKVRNDIETRMTRKLGCTSNLKELETLEMHCSSTMNIGKAEFFEKLVTIEKSVKTVNVYQGWPQEDGLPGRYWFQSPYTHNFSLYSWKSK